MKRKGLSQVLWLIIAAAVLMMVSMALTFTTQGTLGDFASQTDKNACTQTLSNKLSASVVGDTFQAPSTCYSEDDNPIAYRGESVGEETLTPGGPDTITKCEDGWSSGTC